MGLAGPQKQIAVHKHDLLQLVTGRNLQLCPVNHLRASNDNRLEPIGHNDVRKLSKRERRRGTGGREFRKDLFQNRPAIFIDQTALKCSGQRLQDGRVLQGRYRVRKLLKHEPRCAGLQFGR